MKASALLPIVLLLSSVQSASAVDFLLKPDPVDVTMEECVEALETGQVLPTRSFSDEDSFGLSVAHRGSLYYFIFWDTGNFVRCVKSVFARKP